MSANDRELAGTWLRKAGNDLATAKQTLLLPEGPTDTVCFHAQQMVEKALKAVLTCEGVTFPKVHDLVRLLDLCLPFAPELDSWRECFAQMTAYAVEARYPDAAFEPSREEAEVAVREAEEVLEAVRLLLAGPSPRRSGCDRAGGS